MLTPRSIVACLLLGFWLPTSLGATEAELAPELRKMIEWLPADSETLLVVNEPFTFNSWDQPPGESTPDRPDPEARIQMLVDALKKLTAGGLFGLEIKELNEALQDLPVERAIAGSRRFRSANGLGTWPYDGCQIIELKESAKDAVAKVFTICQTHATTMTEIGGHPVAVFERPSQQRFQHDDWIYYVCRPQPGLLLCATNRHYLEEVLARLDKPTETRAFPKKLAQWKHVDVKSPLWALRHYRMDNAKKDPSNPLGPHNFKADPGAIGLTFWLDQGATPKVRHLTKTEAAEEIVSAGWSGDLYGLIPKIKSVDSGVVEVTAEFPTELSPHSYLLYLMVYLGHGMNP